MTSSFFVLMRRQGARSLVTAAIVAGVTLFVVWNLSPWLWFVDSTPTGGDMGAHVWSPAYLRDELLPDFRLTGWSRDWYAGFPAFTFYMVIPSLLIVIVNVGLDLPIDVFSFLGAALAVSEVTRRLGIDRGSRAAAVFITTTFGLSMGSFADGEVLRTDWLGWSPLSPFTYNDTSMDLAIGAIVLPAAVGSAVWHAARNRAGWRGVITTGAVLATVLVVPIPYGVAMKLIVIAGVVTLPLAAYAAGRLGGLAFPGPALLAVMTLPFLFDRSYNIYGGNLMSTMAGEFAYSLGLSVAVLYVGFAARGLQNGRDRGIAAALLALAGLTHLFAAFFAIVATGALFALRAGKRELIWVLTVGPLGALLSAFWVLPFVWNRSMLNDMGWGKERRFVAALWNRGDNFGDQQFLVNDPPLQIFVILAVVGAIVCGLRRVRLGMALSMVAMVFAAAFLLLPEGRLWNVRILPFYYLSIFMMAGIAVSEISRFLADALRTPDAIRERRPSALAGVPAAIFSVVIIGALAFPLRSFPLATTFQAVDDEGNAATVYGFSDLAGVDNLGDLGDFATDQLNFGPGWMRYNFEGYEQKAGTGEYTDLVATMRQVGVEFGCGQSLWEFEGDRLGTYGTTMAPMLLPHWTDGCIGSMEGLYFEASATTPYHFLLQSELSAKPSRAQRDLPYSELNVDKGVDGLRTLGARYYMAFSESALAQARAHPELVEIATSGPWVIFLLADHDMVIGLDQLPVVIDGLDAGGEEWLIPTVAAWEAGPGLPLVAASGPDHWPRMSLDELAEDDVAFASMRTGGDRVGEMRTLATILPGWLERAETRVAQVSDIVVGNQSIRFSVDQVGTPVLVRASYFPNWKVSGADGPYRVSPNLMVVVPTESDIELVYGRSPIELISIFLTIAGLASLVWVARMRLPDDVVVWELGGPDVAMPSREVVFDKVRSGVMGADELADLGDDVAADWGSGVRRLGIAIALAGLTLLLSAGGSAGGGVSVLQTGAEEPLGSLLVFGPLAVALVIAVFGALPALGRAATYRRTVIRPALLLAEVVDKPSSPDTAP